MSTLVVLGSPGGNLYEGLQIASILHDKGAGTYVPSMASCESSCANIFFGGAHRLVRGQLGVHQFSFGGGAGAQQEARSTTSSTTQYTTSEIIGIMNQFETPPFVYEKMFSTGDIHYFPEEDKAKLNLGAEEAGFVSVVAAAEAFIATHPEAIRRSEPLDIAAAITRDTGPAPIPDPVPATPAAPPSGTTKTFENIDFFGQDISSSGERGISIAACESLCRTTPGCAAFSYVTKTRWCWPKSGVENMSLATGTISGITNYLAVSREVLSRPFLEITAADLAGDDLTATGLRNLSLQGCRDACLADHRCRAFSWVAEKRRCFPKYGIGTPVQALGTLSGIRQ